MEIIPAKKLCWSKGEIQKLFLDFFSAMKIFEEICKSVEDASDLKRSVRYCCFLVV